MCAPGSKEWKRRLSWMRSAFYVGIVAMATYSVLQSVVAYEVAFLVLVLFGGIQYEAHLSNLHLAGVPHDCCV